MIIIMIIIVIIIIIIIISSSVIIIIIMIIIISINMITTIIITRCYYYCCINASQVVEWVEVRGGLDLRDSSEMHLPSGIVHERIRENCHPAGENQHGIERNI